VELWEVPTGKHLGTIRDTAHEPRTLAPTVSPVSRAAFSPDGKTLATVSGPGLIALWEVPGGKLKDTLLGRSEQVRLAFSPDGKTLAAVDLYGAIERWAIPEGKALKLTPCPVLEPDWTAGRTIVREPGLLFADNERVIAWGTVWGRTVAWEAPGGKPVTPVSGHWGGIRSIQFSADGRTVVSTGNENRIVSWSAATGKPIRSAHGAVPERDIMFRSSNHGLVLGANGTRVARGALVFDPESGAELFRLPGQDALPAEHSALALVADFDPKRNRQTNTVAIWNLDTRKKLSVVELPVPVDPSELPANLWVAFSPDNSRMVTALTSPDPPGNPQRALTVTGWELKTGKKLGEFSAECLPVGRSRGGRQQQRRGVRHGRRASVGCGLRERRPRRHDRGRAAPRTPQAVHREPLPAPDVQPRWEGVRGRSANGTAR
jgi:WD40 repeat protein